MNVGVGGRDLRDAQLPLGVEQVLHELHRVLALFLRLFEEELRQQGQLAPLEMGGDADVLHARAELVADLVVERLRKRGADHHRMIICAAPTEITAASPV